MRARTQLKFYMAIQTERSFEGAKFNNTPRNNWKPLFEVIFGKNSTHQLSPHRNRERLI